MELILGQCNNSGVLVQDDHVREGGSGAALLKDNKFLM